MRQAATGSRTVAHKIIPKIGASVRLYPDLHIVDRPRIFNEGDAQVSTSKDNQPDWRHKLAVTIPEAADEIGVSRSHIYALIRSGKLQLVKIGRCSRITHKSIVALLNGEAA